MPASVTADVLLLGVGDLGSRIGLLLAERGLDVTGLRRRADLVPSQLRGIRADLTGSDPLPDLGADLLVVCLTADGRDEAAYRRTYLEGMNRALDALSGSPRRAVLVSSTGVYGDAQGLLDEDSPPSPSRATAQVLLEAERVFADRLPNGIVARLSGIYGAGRAGRLVEQVRRGENPDPGRWSNRIHEEDAAAAVVHLLTLPTSAPSLVLVTDDEPAPIGEVRAFIAGRLGLNWARGKTETHGRRLSNERLRGTGFAPTYASYREGYADLHG